MKNSTVIKFILWILIVSALPVTIYITTLNQYRQGHPDTIIKTADPVSAKINLMLSNTSAFDIGIVMVPSARRNEYCVWYNKWYHLTPNSILEELRDEGRLKCK